MIKPSSLYSERIYNHHPLGLWNIDDDLSFFQLFSTSQQDFDTASWQLTNASAVTIVEYTETPIEESSQSRVAISSASPIPTISSTFSFNSLSDFDSEKRTAVFSAHLYHSSFLVDKYRIGAVIGGSAQYTDYFLYDDVGWHKVEHSFDIPQTSQSITFFIEFYLYESDPLTTSYVQFNGISLGQWAEQYNSYTIGYNELDLPEAVENIITSGSAYQCIYADAYGTNNSSNGYYLIKNKRIYAKPTGIPLAYGSYQSVLISQCPDSNPSLIVPGYGFLNESGKYNSYTLEAWVRINNLSPDPVRIIGPIGSADGIYVEEGFISIYMGPYTKSYFVGKWYRPMLLHFHYTPTRVILFINGEQAISMSINTDSLSLADTELNGNSLDYIGIYGNQNIDLFEIDCVSIFPYIMPKAMMKTHFVYGQGVQELDTFNNQYSKTTVDFEFPYAGYNYNMVYPDMNLWRSGAANNLDTTSIYMTTPSYSLPDVILTTASGALTTDNWFLKNRELNDSTIDFSKYVRMRPSNDSTEYETTTIYFRNINVLSEKVVSIFGLFKSPEQQLEDQLIMSFNNDQTRERVAIYLDNANLNYVHEDSLGNRTVLFTDNVDESKYFSAGIHIPTFASQYFSTINNFFSVLDRISLNVGGRDLEYFNGEIFGIHFNNNFFYQKDLVSFFTAEGVALQETGLPSLLEYIANYSLIAVESNTTMALDIGVSGYWEDILPLSIFGKTISASGGNVYDLDMIQFNIDTPDRLITTTIVFDELTYGMLNGIYDTYAQMTAEYSSASVVYSEISDYELAKPQYESFDSTVKSYISFQDLATAGSTAYYLLNTASADSSHIIEFDNSLYGTTKYEILDNHIILTPKIQDFNQFCIGIHLEIKVKAIFQKSLLLRRMELASFSFNDGIDTSIGTKYAIPVYPFSEAI